MKLKKRGNNPYQMTQSALIKEVTQSCHSALREIVLRLKALEQKGSPDKNNGSEPSQIRGKRSQISEPLFSANNEIQLARDKHFKEERQKLRKNLKKSFLSLKIYQNLLNPEELDSTMGHLESLITPLNLSRFLINQAAGPKGLILGFAGKIPSRSQIMAINASLFWSGGKHFRGYLWTTLKNL